MAQPFSEETLELFERADRAIARSIQMRAQSKQRIADCRRWSVQMELALSRQRAETYGPEKQPWHPHTGKRKSVK